MKKEEFINTFVSLAMIYGKEFNKDQLKVYYSLLNDLDYASFKKACGNLAKTRKFMPTVADIREEVANVKGGNQFKLIPEEEWKKVLYCVRHLGAYREKETRDYLGEVTYQIASRFGWEDLYTMTTDETSYMGDRFIKFFKANQEYYKEQLQLNNDNNVLKLNEAIGGLIKRIGDGSNED